MRRDILLAFAVIVGLLGALAAKSLLVTVPPVRSAPATGEFNAIQAKARLARILGDQRPHPADSSEDDAVRRRLVAELSAMGLHPLVRDQMTCNDFEKARLIACARVRNVIATFGPTTGKALLLSAHYDSVPAGPGAGDDGVGVATLLEVGSILKDQPVRRPVILLFNEGEELGLIGARAFLADPISRNVDSLLNFEARGVTGPVTMFETSQPNGPAIAAFAKAVRRPYASSLSADVARLIPNDTDVTTYKERGWLTLNFAMTGNETRYHSPGDDVAALDLRTLQDMGDQALGLTAELATSQPTAAPQQVFVDVARIGLWHMPQSLGAVLLAALLILFAWIAWRRQALVRPPLVALAAIVAAGVAGWLAVTVMGALVAGTYWRAHPSVALTAVYATLILAVLAAMLTLGRRLAVPKLRTGYWFLFLLIGAALAFPAPGAIIYFLAPPAALLAGIAASRWFRPAETICAFAALVLLYLIWGELLVGLEDIFSPGPLWIVAPIAALVIVPILIESIELFRGAGRRTTLLGSALIAIVAWAAAGFTPAYSSDRQQRFTIEHVTDANDHRSYWSVANDGAALPAEYRRIGTWREDKLPFSERKRWLAAAPSDAGGPLPTLRKLEAVSHGSERTLRLRIAANSAERVFVIVPAEARIRAAGMAGFVRPAGDSASDGKFTITCTGRSCDGAELRVDLGTANPVEFTVVGARNGLPDAAAPLVAGRPALARPQYTPDETVAFSKVRL